MHGCGLQVEQGVGVGSGKPFFNRHTVSSTRFIKLRDPPPSSSSPPLLLVLHGRAGNAIGDMASYDYFTLGGPFSVCSSQHIWQYRILYFPNFFFLCLEG